MAETDQDGSSRSSSRGSSFSLCHMTESSYAKVIFCEIHDSYAADENVECLYQLSESVVPHPDDYIGLFRVGWQDLEECITSVPCGSASLNASLAGDSYNKVIFNVIDLPNDDLEYYQFLYLTGKQEVCGASTPFKFHTVHEDENVVVLSAEHDFLEVKSSTSLLHNRLADAQKRSACLEKIKKDLEEKVAKIEKKCDDIKKSMEQASLANQKEIETNLNTCLASIVQGTQVLPELPGCSESLQTMIYSLKSMVDHLSRNNIALKAKNSGLQHDLMKAKADFDSYKARELRATMQSTALADSVKISLQQLSKENMELKEEKCSLQKALNDTKDLFRASEECKSLVRQELESVKKSKDEISSSMEDLKLLNTLLKKQLANNENAIKEMEKVWRELEEVKTNFESEKETWAKERAGLEEQVQDLTIRLKEAAELYKKQFLEIRGLKKQLKSYESSRKKLVSDGATDQSVELARCSSSDSVPSSEGTQTPSCMSQSLSSFCELDSVEPILKKEEMKQCEAAPDSKPANVEGTDNLSWSTCSIVSGISVGKPSAPMEDEISTHRIANSASNAPAVISMAALRELMITGSASSDKTPSMGSKSSSSIESNASRNEVQHVSDTQRTSYQSITLSEGPKESNTEYEYSTEMYDIPCPLCDKMIKVYTHSTTLMDDHLLTVHNQQLCPVCGRMFDKGLPPNYFKYHVENHFSGPHSSQ